MKKLVLLTAMFLLIVLGSAQVKELSETLVESPRFNYETDLNVDLNKSPICLYLEESLNNGDSYNQGTVIVLFTIKSDGSVTDFKVENSVSKQTDQAVINSIRNTSGMWSPGLVNGNPVDMERKILVGFLDPENESLEKYAQKNIMQAIRKYQSAIQVKNNFLLPKETANKRAERKLKSAINTLELANKLLPGEPSVAFWQACAYDKIGNDMMKMQKVNEFLYLINTDYQANYEKIIITLK